MAVELLAGEIVKGESDKAIVACNDYLRMGIGRSLAKLHQSYIETTTTKPPTKTLRTLAEWSTVYGWQARAAERDKATDAENTNRADAHRKAIMENGLAQDHERVNELYEIYEKLKLEFVINGLWYTDIKLSAKGDEVPVEVFNKSLIDSLRATLDDLAKETGGRKQKTETEHSGVMGFKFIEGVSADDR